MVRLIARVLGVGVETADMLVNEVFLRHLHDRKAVARYAGLTGSPDESGSRRRERGLARAGNVRVRSGKPRCLLTARYGRFMCDPRRPVCVPVSNRVSNPISGSEVGSDAQAGVGEGNST
jgi:transposase